ncbi:MAG: hypothetical protein PWQ08_609 [Clostridiales bacterium]|jgi:hypothetical protein|nr:hypothetical protein [Clostridiales bacterium]
MLHLPLNIKEWGENKFSWYKNLATPELLVFRDMERHNFVKKK